jgi:hypothetical protein
VSWDCGRCDRYRRVEESPPRPFIRSFVIRYRYGVTVRASEPVKRPI